MQESFEKAVYYRSYRLKNKSQRYNPKIVPKVTKLVKKLRSQLKETNFDKMDPISKLTFLKEFRDACHSIEIREGVSTWLVVFYEEAVVIVIESSTIVEEDPCNRIAR